MSHTDMFNGEKDLISEYLNQYPVLRYIMPSFTNNGINVSHRLHILRQGYWVLVQILNSSFKKADGSDLAAASFIAANKAIAVPELNLSAQDVELLALLLQIAAEDFVVDNARKVATITNLLKSSETIVFDLAKLKTDGNAKFLDLLTVVLDDSNGLTDKKIAVLVELSDKVKTVLSPGTVPDPADSTKTKPAVLADIANYNLLGSFSVARPFHEALVHTVNVEKLFPVVIGVPILLTLRSIYSLSGSVYLMCSQAQNSFTYAMGPLIKPSEGFTYAFEQNDNGLFILKKMGKKNEVISDNFSERFAELAKDNEFCRVFGAGKASKDPLKADEAKFACGSLINDCIGESTHNVERCRLNFVNVEVPTKKFRGWNKLALDEKRYVSYRILLGLGIAGRYNEDGDLEFVDRIGEPIYTPDFLKALIPNAKDVHVDYVKSLMKTLGVIKTNSKVGGLSRPSLGKVSQPLIGLVINPRLSGVLGMGNLRGVLGNSLNMFGGAQQEENQVSTIQYGGSVEDINKITGSVMNKIETLKEMNPRALPKEKEKYIVGKLHSFRALANEVDKLEQLVVTYITLASKYQSKDIVFTELEIKAANEESSRLKQQMSSKINKFEKLGNLMINKMSV